MNKKYKDYLNSIEWKAIRLELFAIRGKCCQKCGSESRLQIHHLTYKRLFKEKLSDLLILCANCHKKEHGITIKNKEPRHDKKASKKELSKQKKLEDYKRQIERIKRTTSQPLSNSVDPRSKAPTTEYWSIKRGKKKYKQYRSKP